MMEDTEVDKVLNRLGGYGLYQVLVYVALGLVNMRGAWHVFVTIFTGFSPEHYCTPPANHTLNESSPREEDDYGEMIWSQCSMYKQPGSAGIPHSNETENCRNGWTYVWSRDGETSIVSDWDMVCDDNYLNELAITMYMVGATCGTVFLTPLSDRWGRKTIMLACLWVQAVVAICLVFCQSAAPYIFLQFFIGITNMTIALCAYVLVVETFDKHTRELPALSLQFFWAGGIMLLSLFAYLLPDWRHLELMVSIPQVLTITYIWLLPESITWLLNKGKIDRVKETVLTIMRVNKLPPFLDIDTALEPFRQEGQSTGTKQQTANFEASGTVPQADDNGTKEQSYTILDLFKTPRIRRYSVFMFYLYLVNSLSYFGIAFYTPLLNGDKYLNIFISGAVEVPAYIICIICNRRIGRRWPMLVFLLICAAGNIAVIFTPNESASGEDLTTLKTVLVMVGKFGITGSYAALYLYGAEIFPTSIRNHAVGLCSFFENIGSIAAPQIVYASESLTQLPMAIFGGMTVVGAILIIFLPETHDRPLPETIEESENWGQQQRKPSPTSAADKYYTNMAMDVIGHNE